MVGWLLAILLSMAGVLGHTAQTQTKAEFSPSVSLSLPPDMISETVQISYFLIGPFGGHGGYVTGLAGVHSYEIPALVESKAASEIRMIVYAPGCEIQTFVIPLAGDSRVSQEFPCQRVETVRLSGQIAPSALLRGTNAELAVTYMAYWAHTFYGIADGFVGGFHIATISPDANGMFRADLPYFSVDAEASSSEQASFRLMLRDSKTGNHIVSNLEPEKQELRLQEHGLRIRPQYPDDLIFTAADPFVKLTPIRGKVFRSDSSEAISNSYILFTSETEEVRHFDVRTDEKGEYLFGGIPAGKYTVSIYAWFRKRSEVPCQNPLEQKTVDGGDITVEWQWKSQAFMEIVKLKGFSVEFDRENIKDFDLVGK